MQPLRRSLVWIKDVGAELADIHMAGRRLTAAGFAIGAGPVPYRLEYDLETADEFATSRLSVRCRGAGWRRWLELRRDPAGSWHIHADGEGDVELPEPGGDASVFAGALDCDLGLSPLTNTMPVLRHGLHRALSDPGPAAFLMAWVSVPDLATYPSRQRYWLIGEHKQGSVIGFESGDFRAEIVFDGEGFVVDYPGIATRAAT
jgi:hypothetical protein